MYLFYASPDKFRGALYKTATLILLCFAIAACATNQSSNTSTTSESIQSEETGGTNGQLIQIVSDNVQLAGYDLASKVMTVQFKDGSIYEYYGVSLELWELFIAAQPNPWSEVGYPYLVKAGVPYKRIG